MLKRGRWLIRCRTVVVCRWRSLVRLLLPGQSLAPIRLPTVDFSEVNRHNRGTLVSDLTKAQVFKALQEFGCFEAIFNGISLDLRRSLFSSLKKLFDLPLEIKVRNLTEKLCNGYIEQAKEVPIFESLGIEEPES
ncbi:putative non-heme dioxygenase domain, isopenicillin N synthase [Helianthus annuus]|nr:putative non-heme dioxygenase domain, isopenicillin N synthase [Helianthus annuus]